MNWYGGMGLALLTSATLGTARAQQAATNAGDCCRERAKIAAQSLDSINVVVPGGERQNGEMLRVETLDLNKMTQDYGGPHVGRSVDDHALTIKGQTFAHGIGTHANSEFVVDLKGVATRFTASVGVDDETNGNGSVTFEVWADGKKAFDSGVMRSGDAPKPIDLDVTGAKRLTLKVTDAGDGINYDHADWGDATLTLAAGASQKPTAFDIPTAPPRMIVPAYDPKPAIHGPRIAGATPGHPFLFPIAATGDSPRTYSARNLPPGLTLDPNTGIIMGALRSPGTTTVAIEVRNAKGRTRRTLTIVGGEHKLALTPPMGWNSWNCWAGAVDQDKVRQSTDAMASSGLMEHGFQYINIDDTWEGQRDASGEIQTNSKFPDMKALSDYVHGKGLKLGIYSSPGPKTCANFEASWQHEVQDAKTYAKWGIDYLKHDWCSYGGVATGEGLERMKKPYRTMRQALDTANRDIVYSLCQYGMGDVWKWGDDPDVKGNCWRTTGDITDTWGSLHGIFEAQNGHEKYAGPGHWNDPDMLIVGRVGWGDPHPTNLKPNEQILHISLWCMVSSPLLIGCDMARLDPFTTALLSNDEVLDINQDPLGKPAGRVMLDGAKEVWARPLADGTKAVCLVNTASEPQDVTASWSVLGVKGRQPVRDLWMHQDMGSMAYGVTVNVPAHGAIVLKIGKPKPHFEKGSE